jgi:hypothetical protein
MSIRTLMILFLFVSALPSQAAPLNSEILALQKDLAGKLRERIRPLFREQDKLVVSVRLDVVPSGEDSAGPENSDLNTEIDLAAQSTEPPLEISSRLNGAIEVQSIQVLVIVPPGASPALINTARVVISHSLANYHPRVLITPMPSGKPSPTNRSEDSPEDTKETLGVTGHFLPAFGILAFVFLAGLGIWLKRFGATRDRRAVFPPEAAEPETFFIRHGEEVKEERDLRHPLDRISDESLRLALTSMSYVQLASLQWCLPGGVVLRILRLIPAGTLRTRAKDQLTRMQNKNSPRTKRLAEQITQNFLTSLGTATGVESLGGGQPRIIPLGN